MKLSRFSSLLIPALAAVALTVSGCSSLSITTDHDPEADFASFTTYGFPEQDNHAPESLFDRAIRRSIDGEMSARGLTRTETNPDLYVVFQASVNEVVTGATVDHWNTGGWGWYGGWGGGMGTSTVNVNSYNQGTLVVDMVDRDANQLVWRGIAEKSVDDQPTVDQDKINEVMAKLMEDFPPSGS